MKYSPEAPSRHRGTQRQLRKGGVTRRAKMKKTLSVNEDVKSLQVGAGIGTITLEN